MIVWTVVLVAILGVAVAFTVLQPPDQEAVRPVVAGARLPASAVPDPIPDTAAGDAETKEIAVDFDLDCGTATKTTVQASIRQVRLTGPFCERGESASGSVSNSVSNSLSNSVTSVVKNAKNGFIGTVFYPDKRRYTTDYINLSEGENQISLAHTFADGKVENREITIVRAPAATDSE